MVLGPMSSGVGGHSGGPASISSGLTEAKTEARKRREEQQGHNKLQTTRAMVLSQHLMKYGRLVAVTATWNRPVCMLY